MNDYLNQISATARNAVYKRDWPTVDACAREILKQDSLSPEGYFLTGLVEKASQRPAPAMQAFSRALQLDEARYDAAIELANQHGAARRNAEAAALVQKYEGSLGGSPVYLHMAGTIYSRIGMPEKAWPLFQRANELQPGVDLFQSNLANCGVFVGKIEEAGKVYRSLLDRFPTHQRYHYQLSRLIKATDRTHIDQMKRVLDSTNMTPDKNVFIYYALGKELEDLEEWDEAFEYFQMAGNAVTTVADYDINTDLELLDTIMRVCDRQWLSSNPKVTASKQTKIPIFLVGLPRSGTTLVDRIISSHSRIQNVGETQFMQMVLRRESGIHSDQKMTPAMIETCAKLDINKIGDGYMNMLAYKLGRAPMFVDKLPFNILYLGFIAKAFPDARIVCVQRNPMDSCFAMYKQVFAWAYKFSYTLEGLGRFYVAYVRLLNHWRETLKDRLIELRYESLVTDQEGQTREILAKLGVEFEQSCLHFDRNRSATATASSVQVRQKIHSGSVDRWRRYEKHLRPLKGYLEKAGIVIE